MTQLKKCEDCKHFRGSPYEDSYCGHPQADGRPFCVSWKGKNPDGHRRCVYVGQRQHLKGKTALVKKALQYGGAAVLAQFDDTSLTMGGEPLPPKTRQDYRPTTLSPSGSEVSFKIPPPNALGYNWHLFPVEDFEEEKVP
jgi:hypothetical protein